MSHAYYLAVDISGTHARAAAARLEDGLIRTTDMSVRGVAEIPIAAYIGEDAVLLGADAVAAGARDPERFIADFVALDADGNVDEEDFYLVDDEELGVAELSAWLVDWVVSSIAATGVGAPDIITLVVPDGWGDATVHAMLATLREDGHGDIVVLDRVEAVAWFRKNWRQPAPSIPEAAARGAAWAMAREVRDAAAPAAPAVAPTAAAPTAAAPATLAIPPSGGRDATGPVSAPVTGTTELFGSVMDAAPVAQAASGDDLLPADEPKAPGFVRRHFAAVASVAAVFALALAAGTAYAVTSAGTDPAPSERQGSTVAEDSSRSASPSASPRPTTSPTPQPTPVAVVPSAPPADSTVPSEPEYSPPEDVVEPAQPAPAPADPAPAPPAPQPPDAPDPVETTDPPVSPGPEPPDEGEETESPAPVIPGEGGIVQP